ncbi:MAG TPA: cytidine deaminase [Ktedonobacterales bacterium]|jgi:cytidine deaminase|nr:cytidine deaminase [Ktedonobacterales bacterium]
MTEMAEVLIERAAAVVAPRRIGDHLIGDVGCALVTEQGNIYVGVCLDLPSGLGFCAEASAIAAMVTAGEQRIAQIVAVWKNENGALYILSPCGRCREFIAQIDSGNMETEVILASDRAIPLRELLPQHHLYLRHEQG